MKIAILSGSRADAGQLRKVQEALQWDHQVTFYDVSACRVPASREEVIYNFQDTTQAVLDSHLEDEDLIFILGDRYEILAAASTVYLLGKPIAHLSGGDITEGSQDDSIRHAITKLSHLHFVTNYGSAKRVLQLGEEGWRVHLVGCPGVDDLLDRSYPTREWLLEAYKFEDKQKPLMVVVYHPNTLGGTQAEVSALRGALQAFLEKCNIIVIGPNTDADNHIIRGAYAGLPVQYYSNLDKDSFLGLLKYADVLVGNSSAGFYEAPYFGTPVVNIGDRQMGRVHSSNIQSCKPYVADIVKAITSAFRGGRRISQPYGDGTAAKKIAAVIKTIDDPKSLLRKKFQDTKEEWF